MTTFEAALLGAVQGLTEFLPVSSSGHLTLLERELGWDARTSVAFDVVVHLGTLVAVVIAYRHSLAAMLRSRRRAILPIAIGTAPLAAALFARPVVAAVKESWTLLGLSFLLSAALLLLADAPPFARLRGEAGEAAAPPGEPAAGPIATLEQLGPRRALVIGLFQLVAVLPGVSRSGSTISAGLLQRVAPLTAAEMSFLLAIPAILGAAALEARDIGELATLAPGPLAAGFLTALLTGLAALALLKRLLARRRFWVFAPYLLLVGGWCLARGLGGVLD